MDAAARIVHAHHRAFTHERTRRARATHEPTIDMRPQPASLRAGRRVRIASPHHAMRSERSTQHLRCTHAHRP
ncbi:hypothetical protein WM33_08795 [Burkholderia multivorans]|nr:hypothetical protein WM33_08795 [Burkholderia multivorans]KVZ74801.1 hypothetical protein WL23_24320 [Burkholderia multivorans]